MPVKTYTEVALRFELFLSLYAAFPENWRCYESQVEFYSESGGWYKVSFEKDRDYRKYYKWFKHKTENDQKRKQERGNKVFFEDVLQMYGETLEPLEDETTTFEQGEPEVVVASFVSSYVCKACSGTFVHIEIVNGVRQNVYYCPLCGRKAV